MTKLIEWLSVAGAIFFVWLALITGKIDNSFTKQHYDLLLFSPVILIITFGVYAAAVVLYRTVNFNNCEEAAAELQKHITEAKEDLATLGFKFKETRSS